MARKSTLKKPQPLTAAIIAYMQAGEERGDAQCAGLRVRCLASGLKVFFYRCRAHDGALGEIRLGEVGPLTLSKARDAVPRKRLEREQGKDPQLEKRKEREQATLGCPCVVQDRVLNHVDIGKRYLRPAPL